MKQNPAPKTLIFLLQMLLASQLHSQISYTYKYENNRPNVELIFESGERLKRIQIDLSAIDASGKTYQFRQSKKNRAAGETRFKLNVPCQQIEFHGSAVVKTSASSDIELPINFETACVKDLKADIPLSSLNLQKGTFDVIANPPLEGLDIEIWYDGDPTPHNEVIDLSSTRLRKQSIQIPQSTSHPFSHITILRIKMIGQGNQWQQKEFYPWSFALPHEEVLFDSGSADIKDSEEQKLNPVLEQINTAMTRNAQAFDVIQTKPILWISGFTDTVGPAGSNQQLSQARAASIANWFGRHGISIDIRSKGFGERRLKVKTKDNVSNQANRRADYILAFHPPYGGQNGWHAH